MYNKIKHFYDIGLYSKEKVAVFVAKGIITPEQYKEITGEDYKE